MNKKLSSLLMLSTFISGCSLAPDFKLPDTHAPDAYKEQADTAPTPKGNWQEAKKLEKEDRGQWWKIFGDDKLNELEQQAIDANQSLKSAAARVLEARATADTVSPSILPNLDIGGNAVRAKSASTSGVGFGQPALQQKPYTLYSAQGTLSYEADLFGSIRDNYRAYSLDADAEEAAYKSALLALQADVAQNYFALRALDSERQLLRDTIKIRDEAARIMQHKFDAGEAGQQDLTRTVSELASSKADLISLDRSRSNSEHALAVLLGKMPSEFTFAGAPLIGVPPIVPAGLPSTLLERRPDIVSAQSSMEAANRRIGVARAAFFPSVSLTALGGFQSTQLSDLFKWSSRTWALGQVAGTAITMPLFDSGRNFSRLDVAHATYDEAVANYRQQVLVAFRDVEDNLTNQRLLAEQSEQQDKAAAASSLTTEVIEKRYHGGDIDFFEVVNAERDSLATGRIAVQLRGQRFFATIGLIRARGGGWDSMLAPTPAETAPAAPAVFPLPETLATPATVPATVPKTPAPAAAMPAAGIPAAEEPKTEDTQPAAVKVYYPTSRHLHALE